MACAAGAEAGADEQGSMAAHSASRQVSQPAQRSPEWT
jgi:hypothetical protein